MHTTETPILQLTELERQQAESLAQSDALAGQIKAARRREADLKQQLTASQAELAKLGFMQLGKKMLVKAELDNIRKKLAANRQLQESLLARQQACHDQQTALEAQMDGLRAAMTAMPAEPTSVEAAPVQAAQAPAPATETAAPAPAVKAPVAPPKPASPRSASATKPAAPRKPRTLKLDGSLPAEEQISQLTARLAAFYPERQVFSLDSICPEIYTRLNAIAVRSGCANAAELLEKHGFTLISGTQGRALRHGRYCTPGEEPEVIRPLLVSVQRRLEKHYPDRIIPRSLQSDHKSLAQDVSGLCQYLGYDSMADMLAAYGYRYQVTGGGRPATDVQSLLDTLRAAYAEDEKPRTIARLMADHPELAGALKTLQNQAPARFGMPLKQYLAEQGVLAAKA